MIGPRCGVCAAGAAGACGDVSVGGGGTIDGLTLLTSSPVGTVGGTLVCPRDSAAANTLPLMNGLMAIPLAGYPVARWTERFVLGYHRSSWFTAFSNFACHAKVAEHAFFSDLLAELA
jgi:hypothetical protein